MKEIMDSIRVNLFERLTSPLFGAFALLWSGWIYRFFLVAFVSRFEYDARALLGSVAYAKTLRVQ